MEDEGTSLASGTEDESPERDEAKMSGSGEDESEEDDEEEEEE